MIYSASAYSAMRTENSSTYYLFSQARATLIGLVAMILVSRFDYHIYRKFAWPLYGASCFVILLVLTPLGMTKNGARRWLNIFGMSVQPAEIAKAGLIIFFAAFICSNVKSISKLKGLVQTMFLTGIPCALVYFVTDNLSTAIIIFCIVYIMMFVASERSFIYILVVLLILGAIFALVYAVENNIIPADISFRLSRIKAWKNPEAYASNTSYQTVQALYSIGSGGFLGKGLGQSTQKLGYIPEAQNDMIFSIICEELGIFGALAVMLLFLLLIGIFFMVAISAPDLFGSLLVTGVMTHFAVQVLLNIAVVTNTIPNTGITLPFISYGGTSTLFLLAEVGLVLSVSRKSGIE
ncbi:MAG: cell division protein FtsW [Lachnospiraceae bacterium]|nr:cell division protein FtsW [Lachnospiraceae bacterium]